MAGVFRHNQDEEVKSEKAKSASAVDLAIFAQTLLSQSMPRMPDGEQLLRSVQKLAIASPEELLRSSPPPKPRLAKIS